MSNPIYFTFDSAFLNNRRTPMTPDVGMWVEGKQGSKEGTFLAHGSEGIMRDIWQHNRKDTNEVNATVVVWVDGEGLLPSVTFCLVQ
jgi:hypothetical protein